MSQIQIELTERQDEVLSEIAQRLGRSRESLLQAAVKQVISGFEQDSRYETLKRARGIWSSRQLPNIAIRTDRVLKGQHSSYSDGES